MNQVLGTSAGHSVEIKECINYLTLSKRDLRLEIITNELISSVLMMINKISKIEHPSIRETLKFMKIDQRLEIHYAGDIPAKTVSKAMKKFNISADKLNPAKS